MSCVSEGSVTQQQLVLVCGNEALSPVFLSRDAGRLQLHCQTAIPALRSPQVSFQQNTHFFFFLMTRIILCLSQPTKSVAWIAKSIFKKKKFKRYGRNFPRIQRKKRKFSSFWTQGMLIKPTDNHFRHFSPRVQPGVFNITHPFCFSSSIISRN